MKNLFFFLLSIVLTVLASCPNGCSGHGFCNQNQRCTCYSGYKEGDCSKRICPSVDVNGAMIECGNHGSCDETTGLCSCTGGFSGATCNRFWCTNNCNNHGRCVHIKHAKYNSDLKEYEYVAQQAILPVNEIQYVCICDKEYTGGDCSEKKCPTGYLEVSDCETPSLSEQIITFTPAVPNPTGTPNACMVYLEYTDMFNRKYYSDRFCASILAADTAGEPNINTPLGWNDALQRLPIGVIDRETKAYITTPTSVSKITIKYGGQQTGKQPKIKVITAADISGNDEYLNHGLSIADLEGITGYKAYTGTAIEYKNEGGYAIECGGNGVCDKTTGTCTCHPGYGGLACTMTETSN